MRSRAESIGPLGRSPARQPSPPTRPSRLPTEPPEAERGIVGRWLHGAMFDNVGLKFLSMVLAVTVFLLVSDDKEREITVPVGVSYMLPEGKVLVSERLDEVRVTIRGPWSRLRRFDERELSRINVDLRGAPTGEVTFSPDMIPAPAGLKIAAISPRTMRTVFDKRTDKLVEIAPATAGHPQHGYRVVELKPTPATVRVRGAQQLLAALTSVRTREVSLEQRVETFAVQTELVPPDGIEIVGVDEVLLEVKLDQALVTRTIQDVGVVVRGEGVDPAKWSVVPDHVEVTLTGALLTVEKTKDVMVAYIQLGAVDKLAHGADVLIEGVPPGIGVRISPERVKLAPVR